ncbi:MAG: periplasmic heavy metal sensor [Candidatus Marinimicrobia bacterium]|jgi:Spy/CpxP family protein refolding chaperone|nr:periplasmic heavy metal sensor [Candidatus Neomarinimicrobiota bacterium]MBT3575069.1 periplasmic heavy metal sensor [Candidatus Neomarinimicrobiota bacterium]MBT3678841.1 periplasmic heavy metal sensor [Candidatus Neomarinimicrobiota bacterium]MBT3949955.1 periplasmic heavy metal sensor [Candidatus Neomarinimicrobiota bacterium]MBT4252658.1 periplasmic heavy metal sensor [Candidatus Neomarinimicrobiota bacterium]
MYKITRRIIPLLLLVVALPTYALKGPAKEGAGQGKAGRLQEMQLTEEQEDQMQDLRYAHEKILIGLKADLKTAQLELKKLKQADEPNKKKIHAQIEKVGKQRIAIDKARADHHLEVRKVLTAEQFKVFKKKMRTRTGHKGGRKGGPAGDRDQGHRPFRK